MFCCDKIKWIYFVKVIQCSLEFILNSSWISLFQNESTFIVIQMMYIRKVLWHVDNLIRIILTPIDSAVIVQSIAVFITVLTIQIEPSLFHLRRLITCLCVDEHLGRNFTFVATLFGFTLFYAMPQSWSCQSRGRRSQVSWADVQPLLRPPAKVGSWHCRAGGEERRCAWRSCGRGWQRAQFGMVSVSQRGVPLWASF